MDTVHFLAVFIMMFLAHSVKKALHIIPLPSLGEYRPPISFGRYSVDI